MPLFRLYPQSRCGFPEFIQWEVREMPPNDRSIRCPQGTERDRTIFTPRK